MKSDYTPIIFNTDPNFKEIEIYFANDIHKSSDQHDTKKWNNFKEEVLSAPNRYVIFVGDYIDAAIVGSKSDIYSQHKSPQEQKEWFTQQLIELKDRVVCIVSGNHENRITRAVGLYPVYDAACLAGVEDKYRHHFAFVDIGVGLRFNNTDEKQTRYVGFVVHKMRDCKSYSGSDFVDGIDFAAYGHDHDPKDHSRAKLVYNDKKKKVVHKNVEVFNSGAFLEYGGYAVEAGYRPTSQKIYKAVLNGYKKDIQTVGFYI